jgi:hypothetical protein
MGKHWVVMKMFSWEGHLHEKYSTRKTPMSYGIKRIVKLKLLLWNPRIQIQMNVPDIESLKNCKLCAFFSKVSHVKRIF